MRPIVTVAVALIPDMAAKTVQIITVPIARPPLSLPIQWCIIVYNASATPARSRRLAIKTNRGRAIIMRFIIAPDMEDAIT